MGWVDWGILLAYAGAVLGIGWKVSRGASTADGHLRGNRTVPSWAIVFSILASEISAATYIGVPESGFKGNWTYLQFAIGALIGKWIVSKFFVRLYWRLNLPTAYGLLGRRIGPMTQRATAIAFLGGRLVASGVRLFIAALAFSLVTGFDISVAIAVMALVSAIYTLMGGFKAVVWTDVAQGTTFIIGAATALGVGLWKLGLPIADLAREAADAGKFRIFELGANPFTSTQSLIAAIVGGIFLNMATFGTDQEAVQHMLNTRTEKSSGRTVFTSAFITFPVVALFLSVGTMLWVYHNHLPAVGYALATDTDRKNIFPNFIMHVMPTGVRGLVFAGLFAAAISSLGATLNAAAAAWTNDIRPRARTALEGLRTVRLLIFVFGVLLGATALFFVWYVRHQPKVDLVQIALGAMTMLYGGILGTFLVALFFDRIGSDRSTCAGLAAGVAAGTFLFFHDKIFDLEAPMITWPWSLPISVVITIAVASLGRRQSPAAPMGAGV